MYKTDHNFITVINNVQSSWTAKHYEMFEDMTVDEVIAMAGGRALRYSQLVTDHSVLIYTVGQKKLHRFIFAISLSNQAVF